MATVIPFEERAVAHLRQRLGAVEEANEDLIAFARGHSGAVASIHEAVLAAIALPDQQFLPHRPEGEHAAMSVIRLTVQISAADHRAYDTGEFAMSASPPTD